MFHSALRLTTILLAALVGTLSLAEAARPNILFIQTDDQAGWGLGLVSPEARTPNMDRFFKEGAYLTRSFVVTPVCSPSRASLMTSRYGSELGITDWIHPKREPDLGLDPTLPVWPRLLKQAGYRTALVGKWHLGLTDTHHPTRFGFDHFMGHRGGGWSTRDPSLEVNGESRQLKGLTTDLLADETIRLIEDYGRKPAEPFLLCWHTRAPHTRWLPVADEDWAPFADLDPTLPEPDFPDLDTKRVKKMTREYYASIRCVDRNLGRVLDALKKAGLERNTVVIFTSDHGYSMGHHGIWHKGNGHWVVKNPPPATENIPRNQRPNLFDESLLVPTAVRWPEKIKAGRRIDRTFNNLDWFPTLLAMAEVPLPVGIKLRGTNFLPVLTGDESVSWDNDLYAEYSTRHQSRTHMRMIRTPEWKLIRDFLNPDRNELYHLKTDPREQRNLIASQDAEAIQQHEILRNRILKQMKAIGDRVSVEKKSP